MAASLLFNQQSQQGQRLLPAQVTLLRRNHSRHAFLRDVDFGAAGHGAQVDRGLHLSWQVRIVEYGRVADLLAWMQLQVFPAKRMGEAGAQVDERHAVLAAHAGIHFVHFAQVAIGRQPFVEGGGGGPGLVNAVRGSAQDAVQFDDVCSHSKVLSSCL